MFNLFKKKTKQFPDDIDNFDNSKILRKIPIPAVKEHIKEKYYYIFIKLKSGSNIVLENQSEDIPVDFENCLKWFIYRKSDGYLLEYENGRHAIQRNNIDCINVCFDYK